MSHALIGVIAFIAGFAVAMMALDGIIENYIKAGGFVSSGKMYFVTERRP